MKNLFLLVFILSVYFPQYSISQTFTNVGPQLGLTHMYGAGFNGGGLSFVDYDNDGYDDLFLSSSSGQTIVVERNNITEFVNVTSSFNFTQTTETKTILCCDYDNDGNKDILIVSFLGSLKLYKNDNGIYQDVTVSSGLTSSILKATAAIWLDYNRDGFLDLYIGTYSGFGDTISVPNKLYKNIGNGNFTDVSVISNSQNWGNKVLAMAMIDYNNDSWPDIYIASDRRRGNSLLKNNGNGTFSEVSHQTGTYLEMDGMGLSVGDYDNNGYFDIYISNGEEGNAFLKNNGNGTFTNVTASLNMSVNRICWGSSFIDYNNDGYLDLVIAVSGGQDRKKVLFKNNSNGTFTKLSGIGIDNDQFQAYGCAIGDYDNNGYPDVSYMNTGDPVSLWKNSGGTNKWVKVKLQGTYSNRDGIGSLIEVYRNGLKFLRYTLCGQSYCSQNSLIQTIGVGSSNVIDSIIVNWPSGIRQTVYNVNTNQNITIVESGVIGIHNNNSGVPSEFNLYQNYPNPFNPSTIIEYSVPKQSNVTIKIYNVLGSEAAVLVDGFRTAGSYSVNLTAGISEKLSSGIYYYKMTAGEFSQTRKMILIK